MLGRACLGPRSGAHETFRGKYSGELRYFNATNGKRARFPPDDNQVSRLCQYKKVIYSFRVPKGYLAHDTAMECGPGGFAVSEAYVVG